MNKENNNGMHIEILKPDKPVEANPMVSIVENLLSTTLSGHAWKKFTPSNIIELIDTAAKEKGIQESEKHYLLLKRKLTKCTNIEKCLEALSKSLF